MSESIVREAVKEHREQLYRLLIDALMDERDSLESMLSRLRAALGLPADSVPEKVADAVEARRVVVPELTEEALVRASGPYCINDREPFQRGARWAAAFIREHSRAIPADRVLGEGMEVVDREEWEAVQAFAAVWFAGRPDGEVYDASSAWHARRQALRANQGGVEHGNG